MELLHYSAEPIDHALKPARQDNMRSQAFKPAGFWVSVGDDWKQWCESEGVRENRLTHVTKVTLAPKHKILILSKPLELDSFTRMYGLNRYGLEDHFIDWERVAGEHDGLIIAPYIYQRRFELMWYYPWDCASGCIWNTDILTLENVT